MIKQTHVLGLAAAALLSLALAGCKHESEAKNQSGTTQFELQAPANQTITQGTTNQVRVAVDRKDYQGQVDISFDNMPSGVRALGSTVIPANQSAMDFTLEAAADAPVLDNKVCSVRAKGGGAETTQQFKLSVKAK